LPTDELGSGLFLAYTDPDQLFGADDYELFTWGAFAESGVKGY
jgi:hypothetical protein